MFLLLLVFQEPFREGLSSFESVDTVKWFVVFFSVYSSIFIDLSGSKKNIVNDISDLLLDFVYMDLLSILASQGNSPTIVFMLHTCLFSVL